MSELLSQVRETKTLDGAYPVYANAVISLMRTCAEDLSPTALYVLLPSIRHIYRLANEYARMGIDIFSLTEVINDGTIFISPPVVESTDNKLAIVDGIHRAWIARKERIPLNVISVCGADPAYPTIGQPVTWNEVKEYETKPEDPALLRRLRPGIADESSSLRKYYRDLSYLGSSGRRPRDGQKA